MNLGWISVHRKIQEHWIWKDPVKFQWWLDILLTVNHTDTKVNIGNTIITCKRGQSLRSLQTWAEVWKTNKSMVRRFFVLLENDSMIVTENVQKTTRLTVCNYDNYNNMRNDNETIMKRKRNASETHSTPNNNDNNEKNDKKEIVGEKPPTLDFLLKEYWLTEFHPDFIFNGVQGKALNSLTVKIKTTLKKANRDASDTAVLDSFKKICKGLPEWYKDKDLPTLDSKYNEILEAMKKNKPVEEVPREKPKSYEQLLEEEQFKMQQQ